MNIGITGVGRHEGTWVINDIIWIFGWTIPLTKNEIKTKRIEARKFNHTFQIQGEVLKQ